MKKLVIFSLVLLLVGSGLAAGGAAAGGQIYGSYYNGRLHSINEAFSWDDDWFDDDFPFGDDDYHAPVVSAQPGSAALPDITAPSSSPVGTLWGDLSFEFGAGEFRIVEGDGFAVTGGLISRNEQKADEWELSVAAEHKGEPVVITLPAGCRYDSVSIEAGASQVAIEAALYANDVDLLIGAGVMRFAYLDAADIDVDCGAGSVSLQLAGSAQDYGYDVAAAMGRVSLNDSTLVSSIAGTRRIERDGARTLDLNVGAGTIDLFTED